MHLYPFFIEGVCTLFHEDREWLMVIHCTNHQLELAMKDTFLADAAFKEVDKVLLEMYLITRDSGKVKGLLKSIEMRLDVMYVAFAKSDGTRFQNHKYRAIKALIINYIPMSLLMENYIAVGSEVLYTCIIILFVLHFIFFEQKKPWIRSCFIYSVYSFFICIYESTFNVKFSSMYAAGFIN